MNDHTERDIHEEEFSGGPLTETENRLVRRIMRDQQRMSWFWATLRVWAGWAAAIAGFIYATYEPLIRAVKAAFNLK